MFSTYGTLTRQFVGPTGYHLLMNKPLLFCLFCFLGCHFSAEAQRYNVVIDELMADPSPQVGLPNNEWVELRNTTTSPINLSGWRITDATGSSGPMSSFTLKPDSVVIICSSAALTAMSAFGPTIPVTNFPSLDNSGDLLSLKDATSKTIHALAYDLSWYQNELKKNGGWTLEMIDTRSPCAGISNWKASIDNAGGTPGKKNAVDATNNDQLPPKLKRAYSIDNFTIILVFDEPVDSLKAATNTNYSIDGGVAITASVTLGPLFDEVQLKLNSPMQAGIVYTVTANNVADCSNNILGSFNKAKVGLPVDALAGEIIVNEILFNPRPTAYDYIELFNKSNKIFDASRLYVANRNNNNVISSITQLTAGSWLIFPGDYIVITEDAASLGREYLVKTPDEVFTVSSLPSFPDDKGYVIVLDFQGNIIDEVDYFDDWHFKLINNDEGVALERIDPDGSSQDENNWHSAASTAGYGTPAYKNSQYKQLPGTGASIDITPKIFSPDNDGFDDIATIQYKVDAPGYVANITIFDAAGRPIRNLVQNGTLALNGHWNWDGLNDKGQKLPAGVYVIFTEIFNLQGKTGRFKNAIALARKLN